MSFEELILLVEKVFQLAGVLVLVIGAFVAGGWCVVVVVQHRGASRPYEELRQGLGKAILVGLEFLVAADIIRSVAIDPTFQSVGVLGLIVLIRTFLSWSLVVEITGGWPWQRAQARSSTNVGTPERPDSPPGL